jgi:uncharacterized protein (DUF1800 family)
MRTNRRVVSLSLGLLAMAGCVPFARLNPLGKRSELTESERVAHVLSRLTFGARPGDAQRVASIGVDVWIDQQLHPETISDSAVAVALAPLLSWNRPAVRLASVEETPRRLATTPMTALMRDTAALTELRMLGLQLARLSPDDDFFAGKIIRAQMSERQLYEVVVDFWENHFSVYSGKTPSREALAVWDRDVLRPHALGKFRELLGAVAHSPAMLFYLDNYLSAAGGLNENYGRELLELHTLGVDGGYTQHDVVEVARAFTGWTIGQSHEPSVFEFRPERHDTSTKIVLGHVLRAGRGIDDGEEVLDILARQPSTARHIAFKLIRRLVSDDPPPALVDRAAATFTRTDGDIAAVVRTIVTSPEFSSRAAFRAKVKTPFELVVSARRAVDAPADTTPATARLIAQLGQATFGWLTPDGWPEKGAAWMNSGMMYKRIKYGSDLANSGTIMNWRDWAPLSTVDFDHQAGRVMKVMLGGCPEPATRDAMLEVSSTGSDERFGDGRQRLRELLAIAFASPEFQRR